MGRSPGFRVYDHVLNALFRLAFAAAPPLQLNLARDRNSPVHSTKGTPSPVNGLLTICRHTVSGSLSLPLPGCFSPFPHGTGSLSITREYLALGDGPPRFRRNFTCSAVLRIHSRENEVSTTGLLPSTTDLSRSLRLPRSFVTPYRMSYNPKRQASWFGLCSVSLAATQEIAFAFSSSRYLDVSVPWVCLPYPMYSDKDTIPLRMVGFPIRKSSDQSLLTAPRSISALVPSFIDS